MSGNLVAELAATHRQMNEKLTYTLMTAAGGCIGFALTQAKDLFIDSVHVALGASLFMWAVSFFYGYTRIQHSIGFAFHNTTLLKAQRARHSCIGEEAEKIGDIIHSLEQTLDDHHAKSNIAATKQVSTLAVGVVAYVLWQLLLMLQRSSG